MLPLRIPPIRLDHSRHPRDSALHPHHNRDFPVPRRIQDHPPRLASIECCQNHPHHQLVHDDSNIHAHDGRRDEEKPLLNDAMGGARNNDCHWPACLGYLHGGGVLHRWIPCHRHTVARIWIIVCRDSHLLLVHSLQRVRHPIGGELPRPIQQATIPSLIEYSSLLL